MAHGKITGFLRYSMSIPYPDYCCMTGIFLTRPGRWIAAARACRERNTFHPVLAFAAALFLSLASLSSGALAVEPIVIGPSDEKIDITLLGEFYERRGDKLSVETAPSADGIVGRMTVSAKTPGTNPSWVVFALSNPNDKPITRWLTAQRYDIVGSRVLKPDLDAPRITNVTPSLGFRPVLNGDYDH